MMPPVVYALLGFVAALFRSRARYTWKILRCGINSPSINRPSITRAFARVIACSGRAFHASGRVGKKRSPLSNPARSSPGTISAFATTGGA